jgi:predicted lipoprotein with Yx(FWY)xxD motif
VLGIPAPGRPGGSPARTLALVLAVVLGCALVAACGTNARASGPVYEVRAATVPGLGRILVDGKGFTLYMYVPDHDRGRSRCFDVCAQQWPPLVLPGKVRRPIAGPGVRAALLGTTRRPGGPLQVTYNGWPLYLYRDDGQPGQVTGQAVDMGLWFVLSVSGSVDRRPVPGQPLS